MSFNVQEKIEEIRVDIAEIKVDLKYHIKRTDELEKMVLPIYKFRIWLQYTIIIASAISALLVFKEFL